jgi:dihydroxyacetone kinase
VGAFMTSLNMNGLSVTVLYLDPACTDVQLELLDAATEAPAWTKTFGKDIDRPLEYAKAQQQVASSLDSVGAIECVKLDETMAGQLRATLEAICRSLIEHKTLLNKLDSDCGDGDCGDSLTAISQTILQSVNNGLFGDFQLPHKVFGQLSDLLENGGGSLCILLALFFSAAAKAFAVSAKPSSQLEWLEVSLNSLGLGIDAVQEYGRAKPGNRSIVDPLCALRNSLHNYVECALQSSKPPMTTEALLQMMATKTRQSAESTAKMVPKVGRASYVDAATITSPDAGAMAVSFAIDALHKAYSS